MSSIYSFSAPSITGEIVDFSRYRRQVLLVVNVASECGFTPQYYGLESLYQDFGDRGFTILGFPCNQFGGQEPGSASDIQAFCVNTYGIHFPMFGKIDVNGPGAHPLYEWLKRERPGFLWTRRIKWNFTKFLVGRDGRVLGRYGSSTPPHKLSRDIVRALGPRSAWAGGRADPTDPTD